MFNLLLGLAVLAFIFVVFTLIMGAKSMGGKGENAREISNRWMQRRVLGQAVAILLLFAAFYVKRQGGT